MLLTPLKRQHGQKISFALLAILLMAVLQFCDMSSAQAESLGMPSSHIVEMDMSDDIEMDHSCCYTDNPKDHIGNASQLCPDCDIDENAVQHAYPDYKPVFALLYVVVGQMLDDLRLDSNWLAITDPSLHSSQPPIYLANASFLE